MHLHTIAFPFFCRLIAILCKTRGERRIPVDIFPVTMEIQYDPFTQGIGYGELHNAQVLFRIHRQIDLLKRNTELITIISRQFNRTENQFILKKMKGNTDQKINQYGYLQPFPPSFLFCLNHGMQRWKEKGADADLFSALIRSIRVPIIIRVANQIR